MSNLTSKTTALGMALGLALFAPAPAHAPTWELRASTLTEALVACGTLPAAFIDDCDRAALATDWK